MCQRTYRSDSQSKNTVARAQMLLITFIYFNTVIYMEMSFCDCQYKLATCANKCTNI